MVGIVKSCRNYGTSVKQYQYFAYNDKEISLTIDHSTANICDVIKPNESELALYLFLDTANNIVQFSL